MSSLPRMAVAHWLRFAKRRSAAQMDLSGLPSECSTWKFGPDLPASANPARSAGDVWCGIASFCEYADAQAAFDQPEAYLPEIGNALESWRALLVPFAHRGECNHLDPERGGLIFETQEDPGGPLFVMTTAGLDLRSKSDFHRIFDFRRRVEAMRPIIEAAPGNLAHQVFAPLAAGDDGVTMSLWRNDRSMFDFAYRSGAHRTEVDRQLSSKTVDRSSFTRFRVVRSEGCWKGADPQPRSDEN